MVQKGCHEFYIGHSSDDMAEDEATLAGTPRREAAPKPGFGTCTVHGRNRAAGHLIEDGHGNMQCTPHDQCGSVASEHHGGVGGRRSAQPESM